MSRTLISSLTLGKLLTELNQREAMKNEKSTQTGEGHIPDFKEPIRDFLIGIGEIFLKNRGVMPPHAAQDVKLVEDHKKNVLDVLRRDVEEQYEQTNYPALQLKYALAI